MRDKPVYSRCRIPYYRKFCVTENDFQFFQEIRNIPILVPPFKHENELNNYLYLNSLENCIVHQFIQAQWEIMVIQAHIPFWFMSQLNNMNLMKKI
jgi:hypothetical protein